MVKHTVCTNSGKTRNLRWQNAFTLIELLVVVAVIAILLAVSMPTLRKAKALAKRLVCQSNLKQIAIGWKVYIAEHDGRFYQVVNANPDFGGWRGEAGYALSRPLNTCLDLSLENRTSERTKLFRCPADIGGVPRGTTMNAYRYYGNSYQTNLMLIGPNQLRTAGVPEPQRTLYQNINKDLKDLKLSQISNPTRLLLVGDNNWIQQWEPVPPPVGYFPEFWHERTDHHNMAFMDGHAELVHIRKGIFCSGDYCVIPFQKHCNFASKNQTEIERED